MQGTRLFQPLTLAAALLYSQSCSPKPKESKHDYSARAITTHLSYDQALRRNDIRALINALNKKEISPEQYDALLKMTKTNHVTRYLAPLAAAREQAQATGNPDPDGLNILEQIINPNTEIETGGK